MAERGFEFRSRLDGVTPTDVWDRITSWQGVNHELAPFVRMTHPARFSRVTDVPADSTCHFTSYLLFLGVLPFDAHRIAFREMRAPELFDEQSSNLLLKRWSHRRSVRAVGEGVEVEDVCRLEPRLPVLGPLLERVYTTLFARRHRRLRAFYARPDPVQRLRA